MRISGRRSLAPGLMLLALFFVGGCSDGPPPGTLRYSDKLAFAATVVDPRADGAVLLDSQRGAPVLLPRQAATWEVAGRELEPDLLTPGMSVMATLPPQEARIVSLGPSVLTMASSQGVMQVPYDAFPPEVLATTFVPVDRTGGSVLLPLQEAIYLASTSPLLLDAAYVQPVRWDPYVAQQGVLLGRSGADYLVATPVNGTTALVAVPSHRVDLSPGLSLGDAVLFTTLNQGLVLEPWTPGHRVGLLQAGDLGLEVRLVDHLDGAALVTNREGLTFLLPGSMMFRRDNSLVPLASVPVGSWSWVTFPATTAELLTLESALGTFLVPGYGVVQWPVHALSSSSLAQSRVLVHKRNGKSVVVPLQAALNMQRAQGATISPWLPGSVLTQRPVNQGVLSGLLAEHLLLASAEGGRLRLARVGDRGATPLGSRWVGRSVQLARENGSLRVESWHHEVAMAGEGVERSFEVRRRAEPRPSSARRVIEPQGPSRQAEARVSHGNSGGGAPRVSHGNSGGGAPRVSHGNSGGGAPRVSHGNSGGGAPRVSHGGKPGGGGARVRPGGGDGGAPGAGRGEGRGGPKR